MNAGLSNLDTLKKALLASTLQGENRFDLVIQSIGLGMTGLFETFCNRKFVYQEGDTLIFSGDRSHYYLPRFPLVKVTQIQMRYFIADAWTDITDQPISWNPETGLIHFGYTLGRNPLQVKATYTGGFWFETLEPDDANYPSAVAAAIANNQELEPEKFNLPDALRSAWLLQCRAVWSSIDKLGTDVLNAGAQGQSVTGTQWSMDLTPIVKRMLQPFVRYQLT